MATTIKMMLSGRDRFYRVPVFFFPELT